MFINQYDFTILIINKSFQSCVNFNSAEIQKKIRAIDHYLPQMSFQLLCQLLHIFLW